ncbi:enoyl-CoA hydratase/isomerase family protein [Mycolicibacterium sp.]|uniref:enoyl-CoA hydratase/isomerase family protein n=1 Tax=Mycolicibacterium sp. TaxID=2320850 RepID=UPI003D0A3095
MEASNDAAADTPVVVERRGAALWLTLNRPQRRNGLAPETIAALSAGLDIAERDASIRAVVLTAYGPTFCAGADLKYLRRLARLPAAEAAETQQRLLAAMGDTLDRMERLAQPVIGAVNGLTLAGGLELVLACDFVVSVRSARFGDAHANYGLIPGGGGSVRLPRRVGPATARYLMYTGDSMPAEELAHTDLITRVVDDDQLESVVQTLVSQLSTKSPLGVSTMKRLVFDSLDAPLADGLRMELDAARDHSLSADMAEGLAAFADKRTPQFSGR